MRRSPAGSALTLLKPAPRGAGVNPRRAAGSVRSKGVSARLFDADRADRKLELGASTFASVGDRQLLWVDLILGDDGESPVPVDWFPFPGSELDRAWTAPGGPRLTVHGDYFLARLLVLTADGERVEPERLDLAVGKNVVLTAHRRPIPFLAELDERITADTSLGEIDSAAFASVLVDGMITAYLESTDEILGRVDELDGAALKGRARGDLLSDLVALRHRIAATRRALVANRSAILAMAGADFEIVTNPDATPKFVGATERFEGAVDAVDAAREALMGTFDIHMSRTAQRTNDVMKTLTIASILLLSTGVIAGFMGMNVRAPYSNNDPTIFWIVVGLILTLAIGTLVALRVRRWL
jgi:magnesium transporter